MAFPEAVRGYYWGKKACVLLALPLWHQRWNVKGAMSWVDKCLGSLPPPLSTSLSETPTRGLGGITSRYFKALWLSFFFFSESQDSILTNTAEWHIEVLCVPKRFLSLCKTATAVSRQEGETCPSRETETFPPPHLQEKRNTSWLKSFATCQIFGGRERNRRRRTKRGRMRRYRARRRVSGEEECTLIAPGT